MHLNRDQVMGLKAVQKAGFITVNAIVLTGRHKVLNCGVVSVLAIRDDVRFNIRVGVNSHKNESRIIEVEALTTVIDNRKSTNVSNIDGCSVLTVKRNNVPLTVLGVN